MERDNTPAPATTIDLTGLPAPVVQSLQQLVASLRAATPPEPPPRPPLMGRFMHLGWSFPKVDFDEAQKEAWANFPRDFPEPDQT